MTKDERSIAIWNYLNSVGDLLEHRLVDVDVDRLILVMPTKLSSPGEKDSVSLLPASQMPVGITELLKLALKTAAFRSEKIH